LLIVEWDAFFNKAIFATSKPSLMKIQQLTATLLIISVLLTACGRGSDNKRQKQDQKETSQPGVVNVYSHRHYEVDEKLFDQFTEKTGIEVKVVNASADELIKKLSMEGKSSPADVLITVDAGRLYRAMEKDLLQPVSSATLEQNIPERFRDPKGHWYGLTYRARVIVRHKERVDSAAITTYEGLADPKWQDKLLIRSSSNIYNQSLLASIIAHKGEKAAKNWAEGLVSSMARQPKGGDRDQIKAVAAGEGDLAVVNTYYLAHLLNSENKAEVKAGQQVDVVFPNQNGRGTHINVSGAGVTKHAPNQENAIAFLEYLSSREAQSQFAAANYEYPIRDDVEKADILASWGDFKKDTISLNTLGRLNHKAVKIMDQAGWK